LFKLCGPEYLAEKPGSPWTMSVFWTCQFQFCCRAPTGLSMVGLSALSGGPGGSTTKFVALLETGASCPLAGMVLTAIKAIAQAERQTTAKPDVARVILYGIDVIM